MPSTNCSATWNSGIFAVFKIPAIHFIDFSSSKNVATFSPKLKLSGILGISGTKSYGTRKKKAISKVKEILSTNLQWQKYFCEYKKH